MSTILGISAFQHDASAALVRDGKALALIEEERLLRQKHTGRLPHLALEWILNSNELNWGEIDAVAFYMSPKVVAKRFFMELPATLIQAGLDGALRRTLWTAGFWRSIRSLRGVVPGDVPIRFLPHHDCHAAYVHTLFGGGEAAVVTLDSIGEYTTSAIYHAKGAKLTLVDSIDGLDSLGYMYGAITEHLGYVRGDGEGTVMALAALAPPRSSDVDDLLRIDSGGKFRINRAYFYRRFQGPRGARVRPAFAERFGPSRRAGDRIEGHHESLAAALQAATEKAMYAYCERALRLTNSRSLCLSGGVALNCVANHKLRELPIDRLFVAPASNDGGTSLGAAILLHQRESNQRVTVEEPVYLGPSFDDDAIESALRTAGVAYRTLSNVPEFAVEALAQGRIVGWFQGAMESGPRALGNRSILADPRGERTADHLNAAVKHRESFRPFAPAVLRSEIEQWFEVPDTRIPFMTEAVRVRPTKTGVVPAIVHVDGTARVQSVERHNNELFHTLITSFFNRTGVPMLINTSFNVKGEPIVASPGDALRCFFSTGIDDLVIGNFALRKPGANLK